MPSVGRMVKHAVENGIVRMFHGNLSVTPKQCELSLCNSCGSYSGDKLHSRVTSDSPRRYTVLELQYYSSAVLEVEVVVLRWVKDLFLTFELPFDIPLTEMRVPDAAMRMSQGFSSK